MLISRRRRTCCVPQPVLTAMLLAGFTATVPESARAQRPQFTVSTPFHSVRDSFYETSNVNWRAGGSGAFIQFGNPSTLPPFGNADPNAGIRFGFGNGRSNFNFNFAQGSSRSFTSTTPVLTLTDGVPGSIFSGRMRPFVTGVVPIAGFGGRPAQPNFMSPGSATRMVPQRSLANRLMESRLRRAAEAQEEKHNEPPPPVVEEPTPVLATAALPPTRSQRAAQRKARHAQQSAQLKSYISKAEAAERKGKLGVAKIYFRMAAKQATGDLRTELLQRLKAVSAESTSGRSGRTVRD